jgi:putative drug exporter of the RND superfamily
MATALGAGILLDATIGRALLVPALVSVLGRASWWLPKPVARLLTVPARPPDIQPDQAVHSAAAGIPIPQARNRQ